MPSGLLRQPGTAIPRNLCRGCDHIANYDCAIVHGLWSFPTIATRLALRKSQVPYFVYVHGMLDPVFHKLFPWKRWKKTLYWLLAEHRVLHDARAVLFTCEEERDLAGRSFWPRKWKSAIVPYCVNSAPNGPEDQANAFLRAPIRNSRERDYSFF